MTEQEIRQLLPLLIENQLDSDQAEAVNAYLKHSPEMRRELEQMRKTWALLDIIEDDQPDPGFVSRFWTRVSTETPWYQNLLNNVLQGVKSPRWVMAGVSVVMVLCVVTLLMTLPQNSDSIDSQELAMIEEIELIENMDVINDIEFLQDLALIEDLELILDAEVPSSQDVSYPIFVTHNRRVS